MLGQSFATVAGEARRVGSSCLKELGLVHGLEGGETVVRGSTLLVLHGSVRLHSFWSSGIVVDLDHVVFLLQLVNHKVATPGSRSGATLPSKGLIESLGYLSREIELADSLYDGGVKHSLHQGFFARVALAEIRVCRWFKGLHLLAFTLPQDPFSLLQLSLLSFNLLERNGISFSLGPLHAVRFAQFLFAEAWQSVKETVAIVKGRLDGSIVDGSGPHVALRKDLILGRKDGEDVDQPLRIRLS